MLFDLEHDKEELVDLGRDPASADVINACYAKLFEWMRRPSQRTTMTKAELLARRKRPAHTGILLGAETRADVEPELLQRYTGVARQRYDQD